MITLHHYDEMSDYPPYHIKSEHKKVTKIQQWDSLKIYNREFLRMNRHRFQQRMYRQHRNSMSIILKTPRHQYKSSQKVQTIDFEYYLFHIRAKCWITQDNFKSIPFHQSLQIQSLMSEYLGMSNPTGYFEMSGFEYFREKMFTKNSLGTIDIIHLK